MDHGREWAARIAAQVGGRVADYRSKQGLSAQQVADQCATLGFPSLSRAVITKLENGRRETISTAELQVLAMVLNVSPVLLLFPLGHAETVEVLPGHDTDPWAAIQWFSGNSRNPDKADEPHQINAENPISLWEFNILLDQDVRYMVTEAYKEHRNCCKIRMNPTVRILRGIRQTIRTLGMTPPTLSSETAYILGEQDEEMADGSR